MSFLLIAVGIVMAACGAVTIGFGVPINAFSLGNTLIIAGTTAVAGGLLLAALGVVHAQLRLIQRSLSLGRSPLPASPEGLDVAPPVRIGERTGPSALEDFAETERAAAIAAKRDRDAFRPRALSDPTDNSDDELVRLLEQPQPPPSKIDTPPPPLRRASLQPEGQFRWRTERRDRPSWPAASDPPRLPSATDNLEEPKQQATSERATPDYEPAEIRPRIEPRFGVEADAKPAVIKSGTIEGMSYTLFADGSIEADLSGERVHFASLDELRRHIENVGQR